MWTINTVQAFHKSSKYPDKSAFTNSDWHQTWPFVIWMHRKASMYRHWIEGTIVVTWDGGLWINFKAPHIYSLPQKKVYTFVEWSTQNWGGPDEKLGVRQTNHWVGSNWAKPHFEIHEAWSTLDQLHWGCDALPTFLYSPWSLSTWLCRKWILSFGGDCMHKGR